jgi:hypothetical protein
MDFELSPQEAIAWEKFASAHGSRLGAETLWSTSRRLFSQALPGLWEILVETSATQGVTLHPKGNDVKIRIDGAPVDRKIEVGRMLHVRSRFALTDDRSARDFMATPEDLALFQKVLAEKIVGAPYRRVILGNRVTAAPAQSPVFLPL